MRVLVAASLGLALVLPGSAAATVGSLDFRDCVSSDAATTGCSNVSATSTALDAVTHALAVSADGTSVYAAATPDAVVHFARDLATGALTFRDCIAGGDLPATGCSNISATTDSLESPTAIALAAQRSRRLRGRPERRRPSHARSDHGRAHLRRLHLEHRGDEGLHARGHMSLRR